MPKRVVLAGGAGLVGCNLTPMLLDAGVHVVAIDKNRRNLELLQTLGRGIEAHVADMADDGPWTALFAGADAVVDLKAQIAAPSVEVFVRNNVAAQRFILEACRRHRVPHLVHLSSSAVLSVAKDGYAESKRAAEALVRNSGVPHTILRPSLMYGCFDVKHLGYITRVLERVPVLPIPGDGQYLRQPLYVLDLCRIVLRALERGPSGAAHDIIGHERIPFVELLRTIARERRLASLVLPVPLPPFAAALQAWGWLTRRPNFTREQLEALTAGDDFPVTDWPAQFGVAYTPFLNGLREMYASPRYAAARDMASPH